MPVRVLYVMDDFKNVDPRGDTTLALIWESQKRGYENYVCGIHQLGLEGDTGFALCQPVHFKQPPEAKLDFEWIDVETLRSFDDFDFVWMRKDPPVDQSFFTATFILDRHDPKKTLVLNNPTAMRIANEKLWAHFASDLYPRTVVSANAKILLTAAQEMEKIVLKPIDAAGGYGIFVFEHHDKNLRSAIEVLSERGQRPIILQEYLDAVTQGDKRVLLLGGECVGALNRKPGSTDHRANLHVGGEAASTEVTDLDRKIATRLKPHLKQLGLHFVGFDVIGDRLTEVNVTSPTGIREINALEQRSGDELLEAIIWDYAEGLK